MGGSTAVGSNLPANLIDVCADHHDHIEARRSAALLEGLLLHAGANPASMPILTRHALGPVLLDDAGGWTAVTA
jgi:hypothetical protein